MGFWGLRFGFQGYRPYSITRTHNTRTHTVNCDFVLNYLRTAHNTLVAVLNYLRTAHHTRSAVLNTATFWLDITYPPGEWNEWSGPKKCQHFPEKNWVPEWGKPKILMMKKNFMRDFIIVFKISNLQR